MALSKALLLCHLGPLPKQGALEHLSNNTRLVKKKHTPKQVYIRCSHAQKEECAGVNRKPLVRGALGRKGEISRARFVI